MSELVPTEQNSEEDYRAIEEAVMETARGRWFLAEYAKRNRVSDTDRVLDAIESLKSYVSSSESSSSSDHDEVQRLKLELADLSQAIDQLKHEIAHMSGNEDHGEFRDSQKLLEVVVDETESATSSILQSAEEVQEIAWEMRDAELQPEYCDKLDALATNIYTACSFQDLTGQRLRKVVNVTAVIENRLKAMVDGHIVAAEASFEYQEEDSLENGPALPGEEKGQDDIDAVMQEVTCREEDEDLFEITWSDEDDDFIDEEDDEAVNDASHEVGTIETKLDSQIVADETPAEIQDEDAIAASAESTNDDNLKRDGAVDISVQETEVEPVSEVAVNADEEELDANMEDVERESVLKTSAPEPSSAPVETGSPALDPSDDHEETKGELEASDSSIDFNKSSIAKRLAHFT